jgi:hypothetical protein
MSMFHHALPRHVALFLIMYGGSCLLPFGPGHLWASAVQAQQEGLWKEAVWNAVAGTAALLALVQLSFSIPLDRPPPIAVHEQAVRPSRAALPSPLVASPRTPESSLRSLKRFLASGAVPLQDWPRAVRKNASGTVSLPFRRAVQGLCDRFGEDPARMAPIQHLAEEVYDARSERFGRHDVWVLRKVARLGFKDVPAMLQPMIGSETYLELHEDIVVCPDAEVRALTCWDGAGLSGGPCRSRSLVCGTETCGGSWNTRRGV